MFPSKYFHSNIENILHEIIERGGKISLARKKKREEEKDRYVMYVKLSVILLRSRST